MLNFYPQKEQNNVAHYSSESTIALKEASVEFNCSWMRANKKGVRARKSHIYGVFIKMAQIDKIRVKKIKNMLSNQKFTLK